ncbi:hypothetical protein PVAND_011485 [Polypedilum vanderplanki]|uniref:Homeobox domain-containing protein n=1 Tax=Polypedilum vanderplanki TaxID=319348 RepID=A0A9J6CIQ9_POLVA|nr:hypothetical protein PVAND_011485 [Polypedilum vanderplanki]
MNSSDINLPQNSLILPSSPVEMCLKSEDDIEENSKDKCYSSTSMKLTFGVERILMKNDNMKTNSSEKFKEKDIRGLFVNSNNQTENCFKMNVLNDHLNYTDLHELNNQVQNYIVKPFPLRFPKNDKGCTEQPLNYFSSNLRKSSLINLSPFAIMDGYSQHQILRPPQMNNSISEKTMVTADFSNKLTSSATCASSKRKRSWSRAVFSNLQRKGLERQFEFQKYITKPDRKKLAARLGLKDSQVKVWFQNRRMKWRSLTRTTNFNDKLGNTTKSTELNVDEQFTSSDEEDAEIDVVTDR